MNLRTEPFKDPLFHVIAVAAVLAGVWMSDRATSGEDALPGVGHHRGRCHACQKSATAAARAARDAALLRAGCIDPPAD